MTNSDLPLGKGGHDLEDDGQDREEFGQDEIAPGSEGDADGRKVIDLLEPAEGLPPVTATADGLAAAVAWLAEGTGPVAVDAERASGYRYGQKAYLVQLRRAGAGTVLIDPIACPDLSGLDTALADVEAVLHAASQDLPCLAEIGYQPKELFDTELAGRLLGYPRVALGTMLEEVLGFRLAKEHSAADWSVRPLPAEMLKYAALDVEVLTELRDALAEQLLEQGKAEWARQEFAAIAAAPPPQPRADPWRRTSGIHKVRTRRALAVVRELWQTRDEIARDADQSPRRVLSDQAIVDAARAEAAKPPPTGRPQLDRISGFHARYARKYSERWTAAVLRARQLGEADLPEVGGATAVPGPPPTHRWAERDPAAAARLGAAREAVGSLATAHRLPIENLLPPDALRRLAWEPPDPATPETITATLTGYGARPWQAGLTAVPLAAAFAAAAMGHVPAVTVEGTATEDGTVTGDGTVTDEGTVADEGAVPDESLGITKSTVADESLGTAESAVADQSLGTAESTVADQSLGTGEGTMTCGSLVTGKAQ